MQKIELFEINNKMIVFIKEKNILIYNYVKIYNVRDYKIILK